MSVLFQVQGVDSTNDCVCDQQITASCIVVLFSCGSNQGVVDVHG